MITSIRGIDGDLIGHRGGSASWHGTRHVELQSGDCPDRQTRAGRQCRSTGDRGVVHDLRQVIDVVHRCVRLPDGVVERQRVRQHLSLEHRRAGDRVDRLPHLEPRDRVRRAIRIRRQTIRRHRCTWQHQEVVQPVVAGVRRVDRDLIGDGRSRSRRQCPADRERAAADRSDRETRSGGQRGVGGHCCVVENLRQVVDVVHRRRCLPCGVVERQRVGQ